MLNGVVQRAGEDTEEFLPGSRRDGIYRLQQHFDVPVSAVSVRIAVRDVATGNVGALEVTLPLAAEDQATEAKVNTPVALQFKVGCTGSRVAANREPNPRVIFLFLDSSRGNLGK